MKALKISLALAVSAGVAAVALTQGAYAASQVDAMPDRQVRPGVALPVFGSADGGLGTADAETYTWACDTGLAGNILRADDGLLTDVINLAG